MSTNGVKIPSIHTSFWENEATWIPPEEPIAVIGLSCRFPGANNYKEFWQLLANGKSAIQDLPLERQELVKASKDGLGYVKRGGFLKCPVDEFDAHFFGISAREAPFMDPQQRLLLEVLWEALENAGIDPHSLRGTQVGVFIGIWACDYAQVLLNSPFFGACEAHDAYLGCVLSAIASRISFFLGTHGPNAAIDAGCASSLQSVHQACLSLRSKETNVAVAGGVNLIMASKLGKANSLILASDGHCKTFDAKADGFGRAEGCGILILKRLSDATRDGDKILALVRSSAINCDGTSSTFGTPCKLAQAKVIRKALKHSKLEPQDITYIEAHGTGTQIGDPIEFSCLNSVFANNRKKPLIVGSVKTNIGHSEAAAGVAGIIKIILSLQNELIPAHLNLKNVNPAIDLGCIPATIPVEAMNWPRSSSERRIAGISAFALSGHNAHIIIEEGPETNNRQSNSEYERPLHILTLSAKTEMALQHQASRYIEFIKTNPGVSISDVAFTANTGRAHFMNRLVVIGKDSSEIQRNLDSKKYLSGSPSSDVVKIAFLFTDQNTKFLGISDTLYKTHPIFKNSLDQCAKILDRRLEKPLLDTIFRNDTTQEVTGTSINQAAIFSIQYSLVQLWRSFGIHPDYVLGYSTGEYAAAAAAGILSLEDAISLIVEATAVSEKLPAGNKLTISGSLQSVQKLAKKFRGSKSDLTLDISAVHSNAEVAIVGKSDAIKLFSETCLKNGLKTTKQPASNLLHSPEVENIPGGFADFASNVSHNCPEVNYVSGMTGKLLGENHFIYDDEYWQKHLREKVNFSDGVNTLYEEGCKVFIEIGPHPALLGHIRQNIPPLQAQQYTFVPSLRHREDEWTTILNTLGTLYTSGVNVNWKNFDASYMRQKVDLPTYPFQRQKFWAE